MKPNQPNSIGFPSSGKLSPRSQFGHPRWLSWLAIAAFWCFVSFLMVSGQLWTHFNGEEECAPLVAVYAQLPQYAIWALATPFIFYLTRSEILARWHWCPRLGIYLGSGILLTIMVGLTNGFFHNLFLHPRGQWHLGRDWTWTNIIGQGQPNFLVFLAVLSAGFAICYFQRYRRRQFQDVQLQNQLTQARFQALQMQIQPHFLFNTLNTVSALVDKDPDATRRTVARLSQMLRHTLDCKETQLVTLERELEFLNCYIEILTIRFENQFFFSFEIEDGVGQAMVPNLIFQPLVENAVKHGFNPMPKVGQVIIGAASKGKLLHLWVSDNGKGVNGVPLKWGVGLGNIRARLEQLWGNRVQWNILPGEEQGMTVDIQFPLVFENAEPSQQGQMATGGSL